MTELPTDIPYNRIKSTGKAEPPPKPTVVFGSLLEEMLYCKLPIDPAHGIYLEDLVLTVGTNFRVRAAEHTLEDTARALQVLKDRHLVVEQDGFLYRTNWERSICLRFL